MERRRMVYRLSTAGMRRMVLRSAVSMVLMYSVVVLVIGYAKGWHSLPAAQLVKLTVLLVVAFAVSVVLTVRRQRRAWVSFEIEFDGKAVVRRMEGFAELRIERGEVVAIVETAGRGLAMTAGGARPLLWIDSALEGYEQVRETFARWRPIAVRPRRDVGRLAIVGVAVAAALGASGVAYTTDQLRWFVPTGVPLIGLMIWGVVWLPRNPNVDAFTRRAAWVGVMPVFALVWKLVMLLRQQE